MLDISQKTGVPVNQFLIIFDLECLSMAQMAYKEGGLSCWPSVWL